jgi:hypothetical protein
MLRRLCRFPRSHLGRTLAIAAGLVVAWAVWWHWPPQPDWRLALSVSPDTDWYQFAADGRTLVCVTNGANIYDNEKPRVSSLYELPSGVHRGTFPENMSYGDRFSPDGLHVVSYAGPNREVVRSLPSGELRWVLPPSDGKDGYHYQVHWSADGKYLLVFDSQLSVFHSATGELIGRYPVNFWQWGQSPNGSGFVARITDTRELMLRSFDSSKPATMVPLPGPQSQSSDSERPATGSISIDQVATNNDQSAIFAILYRHTQEGEKDRRRRLLARWDRATNQWTECDMGPDAGWSSLGVCVHIDPTSRFVATKRVWHAQFAGTGEIDNWGVEEARQHYERQLWTANAIQLTCLNDQGFPAGIVYFDQSGRRLIQAGGDPRGYGGGGYGGYTVYDAMTLKALHAQPTYNWEDRVLSPNDEYAAIYEVNHNSRAPQLPAWVPSWVQGLFESPWHLTRVIRLADGKTVRTLKDHLSPAFTPDDKLLTVTPHKNTDDSRMLLVECWSPEPPTPWWLWALTSLAVMLVLRNHGLLRRRPVVQTLVTPSA